MSALRGSFGLTLATYREKRDSTGRPATERKIWKRLGFVERSSGEDFPLYLFGLGWFILGISMMFFYAACGFGYLGEQFMAMGLEVE